METTTLELHNNEWLSDALRRGGHGENIPTNVILDKRLRALELHTARFTQKEFHYNRAKCASDSMQT